MAHIPGQSGMEPFSSVRKELTFMKRSISLILCTVALWISTAAWAQQVYTLTDIAPCSEVIGPFHMLINASGQIAGYMYNGSGNRTAYVWSPSIANAATGTFAWLPVPTGTHTSVPY